MHSPSITVLIPCLNEEAGIGPVIADFRRTLPEAWILVVDNNSTDRTQEAARAAGAEVVFEPRPGKATAILSALPLVSTDVLIMVDGDGSYPAEGAALLIKAYGRQPADMITGVRTPSGQGAAGPFRPAHVLGGRMFSKILDTMFGHRPTDVFSGLRLFSRHMYQSVPILSRGFELEMEFTIQAIDKGFRTAEVPVPFADRAAGSASKLRTFRDGFRILYFLFKLVRDYRPVIFFGFGAGLLAVAGLTAGYFPIVDYIRTQLVNRLPLAVLAAALMSLSALSMVTGLILESNLRHHREMFQIATRIRN